MIWLLLAGAVWASVAAPLAVLLGRSMRLADHREAPRAHPTVPDFLPEDWTTSQAGTP